MIKKVCIILLLAILIGGWLIFALIIGFDNFYEWCQNHRMLMGASSAVEFLLCIPLLKSL